MHCAISVPVPGGWHFFPGLVLVGLVLLFDQFAKAFYNSSG